MARIEKTVFISYRRKDISWALAVYQYLASQKYDVFFDYTHIPSGDFEQIIVSNIKARAHFVLILTPTTLDRCSNPDDWVRREIETAMDEKRNVVPLFFDGFSFGSPGVAEKLTGKLADVKRYNGLDVPSGYFPEAMERLRTRYLNVPLSAVLHPVSTEVKKVVKEEKNAANKALVEQKLEIKELVKSAKEKAETPKQPPVKKASDPPLPLGRGARGVGSKPNLRPYALGVGILLLVTLGIAGIRSLMNNTKAEETPHPTQMSETIVVSTATSTKPSPMSTVTITPTSIPPSLMPSSTIRPSQIPSSTHTEIAMTISSSDPIRIGKWRVYEYSCSGDPTYGTFVFDVMIDGKFVKDLEKSGDWKVEAEKVTFTLDEQPVWKGDGSGTFYTVAITYSGIIDGDKIKQGVKTISLPGEKTICWTGIFIE